MSDAIIRTEQLSKVYRTGATRLEVLSSVDIEVRAGEILSIVGASGAGKSTLLHLIGLLDVPSGGSIIFKGQEVTSLSPRRRAHLRNRAVGFVFQFYHLIGELSALENVLLPLMIERGFLAWRADRRRAEEKARQLLHRVGLEARQDHRPSQLSGGERQRVAIARALIGDTEVLLLDEPTGNLDEQTSEGIHELLWSLREDDPDRTFVLVTHDEALADRSDRKARVHKGRALLEEPGQRKHETSVTGS